MGAQKSFLPAGAAEYTHAMPLILLVIKRKSVLRHKINVLVLFNLYITAVFTNTSHDNLSSKRAQPEDVGRKKFQILPHLVRFSLPTPMQPEVTGKQFFCFFAFTTQHF